MFVRFTITIYWLMFKVLVKDAWLIIILSRGDDRSWNWIGKNNILFEKLDILWLTRNAHGFSYFIFENSIEVQNVKPPDGKKLSESGSNPINNFIR